MRKTAIIINCMIIILLFSQPFFATLPSVGDGEGLTHFPSPDPSGGVAASIASEEENIDSFDVNPKSGRWNVTNDNNTDDLVTDSILRMTTINNLTSDDITDPVGYEMNRGTTKTDGKVEYRMAASGGGNQTEFFRDVLGDKCDFEEGDDENIVDSGHFALSVNNGLLDAKVDISASYVYILWVFDDISGEILNSLRFKLKGQGETNYLRTAYRFTNGTIKTIQEDVVVSSDFQTYEHSLSITNTIDRILIYPKNATGTPKASVDDGFFVEFVELIGDLDYATHIENEIEDTWDWEVDNSTESWTGLVNMNVSKGFLRGTMVFGPVDSFWSPVALNIDTDLFNIFSVRLNTSDITMDITIQADLGAGLLDVSPKTDIDSTSQTIYTFDLSDDSDWAGTAIRLLILFNEQDMTLDGDETVFIDYVLLLGHWDDSNSVIGLFDQDNLVPLLNVSTVFTSDNNHSTTSDKAYFTVELLDLDGDVAYSAFSANFTDISDLWIKTKITFDVLRSKLTVTIHADNLTRINKWTFPADFTEESGRIPALFSHEKNPYIFVSTFCQAISWQEMKLDYIKAGYKEREWTQVETPTDDFIHDSWDGCRESNDSDQSIWEINIPSLDAYSGSITANTTDNSLQDNTDNIQIGVELYGVDANDGDRHLIVGCSTGFVSAPLSYIESIYGEIYDGDFSEQYESKRSIAASGSDVNPLLIFSLLMKQDRTIGSLKVRYYPDIEITNEFIDWMVDFTVSDYVNDPSQEFALQVFHNFNSIPATYDAFTIVESFAWMERDRLSGFPGQIEAPTSTGGGGTNWLAQIFIEVGRFMADAFGFILDPLFASLGVVITALQPFFTIISDVIGNIQGWLTSLGTIITDAIANIQGWVESLPEAIGGVLTFISDAVEALIGDFFDILWGFALELGEFLFDILEILLPLLLGLIEYFIDLIAETIFFVWGALGLPDVLAIVDMMLTPIFETITGIPQAILDFIAFFTPLFIILVALYWFWLIFLAFAQEGFDPFAGLAESFGRLFTTLDFSIMGFGPIPFPIALFFIPLTYFLILPPESMFAIW